MKFKKCFKRMISCVVPNTKKKVELPRNGCTLNPELLNPCQGINSVEDKLTEEPRSHLEASIFPPALAVQFGHVHSMYENHLFEPPLCSTRRDDVHHKSSVSNEEKTTSKVDSTFSKSFWSDIRRWGGENLHHQHGQYAVLSESDSSRNSHHAARSEPQLLRVEVHNVEECSTFKPTVNKEYMAVGDHGHGAEEEDCHPVLLSVVNEADEDAAEQKKENCATSAPEFDEILASSALPVIPVSELDCSDETQWFTAFDKSDIKFHSTPKVARSPGSPNVYSSFNNCESQQPHGHHHSQRPTSHHVHFALNDEEENTDVH